tara:strand:+ start:1209 stop:1730 length:522 start_codon:yes stop_codon:yes gene_type:complete
MIQTLEFKERADIITERLDNTELNKILIEKIKKIGDVQNCKTNLQGDMTSWRMQEEKEFNIICKQAIQIIERSIPKHDSLGRKNLLVIECWGGVYRKGSVCHPHNHIPCAWSFVYYAQATHNDAPLVFPTASLGMRPETGLLVAFPGWVTHNVPIQEHDSERIIVAGNFKQVK